MGHQNIDLKQIDCQIFLQKRWVYSYNRQLQFQVCSHGEPHESLAWQGKDNSFIEGKKKVERAMVNKNFVAFHWLSSCQEKRGVFLLPSGLCYFLMGAPLSGLLTLLKRFLSIIFIYLFFLHKTNNSLDRGSLTLNY